MAARERTPRQGRGIAAAAVVALLLAASCTSGPPEIGAVDWTLELRPGKSGGARESLAVFVKIADPDGIEDIDSVWILADAAELEWSLGPSSWTRKDLGQETWLGGADLSMADGSPPPRGLYRVVVADLAGNRTAYEFKFDARSEPRTCPLVALEGASLRLESQWPENYVLGWDAAGNLVRGSEMRGKSARLEALFGSADAERLRAVTAYGYDATARTGAYSERMKLK